MKHYTLLIFFTCFLATSQAPITKSLGEFSELKVYDLINVELIQSTENKIEITGEDTSNVYIVQKNNLLKIKMDFNKPFNGNKTFVKLYYTKIDIIDVNEGAKVVSTSPFKQYELELKTQEGGYISVVADLKLLSIKSVTGGSIKVKGKTQSQNINIRTGGIYEASLLKALNSQVKIKTGGVADISSSELIEVRIFAGGDLTIHGKTKYVKQLKTAKPTLLETYKSIIEILNAYPLLDFVKEDEKDSLKPGSLIIDVSCDEGMGFYFAIPTTFKKPILHIDKIDYYAVDHTPSYYWESASRSISAALLVHVPSVISGRESWNENKTIKIFFKR